MSIKEHKNISRHTDEDIIYVLASRLRIKPEEAKNVLSSVTDCISKCLIENRTLHIRKLGLFYLQNKKAAKSKNFEGKTVIIPSYDMIRFKPATFLKEKIRQEGKTKIRTEELI